MCPEHVINPHQQFCAQVRARHEAIRARFGLDWDETARLVNRHLLAAEAWLSSRGPRARRFEGRGTTAVSTGIPVPVLNLALDADFSPGSSDQAIDDEIEDVKSFFVQRGVGFIWGVTPFARPSDMGERLTKHGLVLGQYQIPAMVAPLSPLPEWPQANPGVAVWQANSLAELSAASEIKRFSFGIPETVSLMYYEGAADDWLRGDPARLYLARLDPDGPPVAIGQFVVAGGVPGISGMVTLPECRRRGVAKAMLARMFSDAASDGHDLIALGASAQAYSLYRAVGFEHLFEYAMYGFPQPTSDAGQAPDPRSAS